MMANERGHKLQIAAGSLIGGGANAETSASIHVHDQFEMICGVADLITLTQNECLFFKIGF